MDKYDVYIIDNILYVEYLLNNYIVAKIPIKELENPTNLIRFILEVVDEGFENGYEDCRSKHNI